MRAAVLLSLTLVSLALSHHAQAETEPGRILLAQRILSCGEQANTLYLQFASLKCKNSGQLQPDAKCEPLMAAICALADKCARAKAYCVPSVLSASPPHR